MLGHITQLLQLTNKHLRQLLLHVVKFFLMVPQFIWSWVSATFDIWFLVRTEGL